MCVVGAGLVVAGTVLPFASYSSQSIYVVDFRGQWAGQAIGYWGTAGIALVAGLLIALGQLQRWAVALLMFGTAYVVQATGSTVQVLTANITAGPGYAASLIGALLIGAAGITATLSLKSTPG